MGLTHVSVKIRSLSSTNGAYEAEFLVDTGATDSLVPAAELNKIGVQPVGNTVYELANGTIEKYSFGLVEIAFMGDVTAGRVIFGPDNAEPLPGVTALESVGITIDPANRTLKRLPAIPLKQRLAVGRQALERSAQNAFDKIVPVPGISGPSCYRPRGFPYG